MRNILRRFTSLFTSLIHEKKIGPRYVFERVLRARVYQLYDPAVTREILKDTDHFRKPRSLVTQLEGSFGKSLLTDDGPSWERMHKLLADIFTPRAVQKNFAAIAAEESDAMIDRWLKQTGPIDAEHEMREIAARIICRSIFGAGIADQDIHTIVNAVSDVFAANEARAVSPEAKMRMALGLQRSRASTPSAQQQASVDMINSIIDPILQERKKLATQPDDILGRLISATHPDGVKMSDQEIRNQIVLFIVAGHETTAVGMTFTLAELLQHPEAERALQAEVNKTLAGRNVAAADYPQLGGVSNAFREGIRLHPPAHMVPREAVADTKLGGIEFKKDDLILMTTKVMHCDPTQWEKAAQYLPARFEKDPRPASYMPFGAGPRVCLGLNMAMVEATIVLAEIFNRTSLKLVEAPTGEAYTMTLRPKGRLLVSVSEKPRV